MLWILNYDRNCSLVNIVRAIKKSLCGSCKNRDLLKLATFQHSAHSHRGNRGLAPVRK